MFAAIRRYLRCEVGNTAMEYAFIAALVSTGIFVAVSALSGSLNTLFASMSSTITGVAGG